MCDLHVMLFLMLVLNKWVARETPLAGGEKGSNKKGRWNPTLLWF